MPKNYLEHLPADVQKAIHHDFVFIIKKNLVQHYPARQWSDAQILDDLEKRFGVRGKFFTTENYRGVDLGLPEVKIIVP